MFYTTIFFDKLTNCGNSKLAYDYLRTVRNWCILLIEILGNRSWRAESCFTNIFFIVILVSESFLYLKRSPQQLTKLWTVSISDHFSPPNLWIFLNTISVILLSKGKQSRNAKHDSIAYRSYILGKRLFKNYKISDHPRGFFARLNLERPLASNPKSSSFNLLIRN